jgi:transcriptional regulator with XRE-family HTH domain
MNKKLKSKIFERFGTQCDFSRAVDVHESLVSRVLQGRRTLTEAERQRWADLLEADCKELFGEEANDGTN